ncbi:glycosyltransferase family 4 protein, partial [Candidatus Omnitrophota bacterium]
NLFVHYFVRNCDGTYAAARFLCDKAKKIYKLKRTPVFLPTPVLIATDVKKAKRPTVCYIARLDRRKRPEVFLELVSKFPKIDFIMIGSSRDKKWEKYLNDEYASFSNLKMLSFVDQFSSNIIQEVLLKSWIFINTSSREGLPNAFIEALAYKCALLSCVNPDDFASEYGYCVQGDEFEAGLRYLLKDNKWKMLGQRGYDYIKNIFEISRSLDQHIAIYNELMRTTL